MLVPFCGDTLSQSPGSFCFVFRVTAVDDLDLDCLFLCFFLDRVVC